MTSPFPWWRIALAELGVSEKPGQDHNVRILEYLRSTSIGDGGGDETAWCSAFANWCITQAGLKGTGSAWARSWLEWGQPVALEEAQRGAVAVFTRAGGGGHVGFFQNFDAEEPGGVLRVLGGNQNNRVQVSSYPASRLLGIRVPA